MLAGAGAESAFIGVTNGTFLLAIVITNFAKFVVTVMSSRFIQFFGHTIHYLEVAPFWESLSDYNITSIYINYLHSSHLEDV